MAEVVTKKLSRSYLHNVGICCIIKDETEYLKEWIQYHKDIGVEYFILFDNCSKIPIEQTIEDKSGMTIIRVHGRAAQIPSYSQCIKMMRGKIKWIAFIDADEFIVLKKHNNIKDLLKEYDFAHISGLGANWVMFGTSGHKTKPDGKVTENFIKCANADKHIKSIVRPDLVTVCTSPHEFKSLNGKYCVNEKYRRFVGPFCPPKSSFMEKIQINHYFTKSEEEYKAKIERGRADFVDREKCKRQIKEMEDLDKECVHTDTSIADFYKRKLS